jgi:hypothetical protein
MKKFALLLPFILVQFFCYAHSDSIKVRKNILKVARQISRCKTVDRGPVGFSAQVTRQFNRYIYLINHATEEELISLTDYKAAIVRAYSFEILVSRSYRDIRKILYNHVSDIAIIKIRGGCITSTEHINLYFLKLLTPRNLGYEPTIKLTEAEANDMKAKMTDAINSRRRLAER